MTIAPRTNLNVETTISATEASDQDADLHAPALSTGGVGHELLPGERQLLDAYRAGQPDALARLYHHYAQRLARFLRSGLSVQGSEGRMRFAPAIEADIEELLQDTFVRAFSDAARRGYDGVRPFGAYLVGIAKNLAIDRARRRGRHLRWLQAAEQQEPPAAQPADEGAERAELQVLLNAFLAGRDGLDRDVFRERYVKNQSLRQAAKALGLGVFRVRRRDVRLRRDLLAHLREHGYLLEQVVNIGEAGVGGAT